ncbi:MAG: hypothetical protein AB4063_25480 [Crocosphaera sp.]
MTALLESVQEGTLVQQSLKFHRLSGEALLQERETLIDIKDIQDFTKKHGGKKIVEPYLQIATWFRSLSKEWLDKLNSLPFWTIEKNQWAKLAQLTVEQLEEWYNEIVGLAEELHQKSVTNLLSLSVFDHTIAKFLPKAPKKTIPLRTTLDDEHYEIVRNIVEYDFTDDSFSELKQEVIERAEGDPKTEDLFEPLKARGLDPFLILTPTSQLTLENQQMLLENQQMLVEHEKDIVKLQEKDKIIVTLEGQVKAFGEQVVQIKDDFTQQTQQLEQQLQQQEAQYKNQIDQHQKEIAQLEEHFDQKLKQQLDQRDLKHQNEIAQLLDQRDLKHQNEIAQLQEQMTAIIKQLPELQQATA